jgi:hypothetical protein
MTSLPVEDQLYTCVPAAVYWETLSQAGIGLHHETSSNSLTVNTKPLPYLEALCSSGKGTYLVHALPVAAQDEVHEPVEAVDLLAVLLHTQLLQISCTLGLVMPALPAAIRLCEGKQQQEKKQKDSSKG